MKIKTSNLLGLIIILASTTVWSGSGKPKDKGEIIFITEVPNDDLQAKLKYMLQSVKGDKAYFLQIKSKDGTTVYLVAGKIGCEAINDKKEPLKMVDLFKSFSMSKIRELFEKNGISNSFPSFIDFKLKPIVQNLLIVSPAEFDPSIFSREVLDVIAPEKLFGQAKLELQKLSQNVNNALQNLKNFIKKEKDKGEYFKNLEKEMLQILKGTRQFESDVSLSRLSYVASSLIKPLTDDIRNPDPLGRESNSELDKSRKELLKMAQQYFNAHINLVALSQSSELTQEQKQYFKQLDNKI